MQAGILNLSRSKSVMLTLVMVLASLSPLMAPVSGEQNNAESGGFVLGDFAEFNPLEDGKRYMFVDSEEGLYSATRFHKQAWVDAGYPDMIQRSTHSANGKASSKNCVPYSEGTQLNVPTSSGQIPVQVEKVTNTAAFLVETSQTVSSTTLNNLASTWDTTIYPTNSNYFGIPPDVDNNCQIEIIIYNIDGGGGTGGYFSPSLSGQREAVFVDVGDLGWANTILAHEFQHLLHNFADPFEYIWIDEGNADMAAYLCFGATNTIIGHANSWAQSPHISVRWWNQSLADYGAGFLFMLYLASKLGGGQAIQSLVADTATGGAGIVNLANNPVPGSPGNIGSTMPDIFANFTVATLLDDSQNPFGLDNIDMYQNCGSTQFCRLQLTDQNSNWGSIWQRSGDSLFGWGVRAYKFTGGTGTPLNVMVQASEIGFAGRLVYRNIATGTWTADPLIYNGGVATGLVPGFGNVSDDVHLVTWYESGVDDCDYTLANCGWPGGSTTYPTATIDVFATLISQPATIRQNYQRMHDRDGDGMDDTMEWNMEVNSTAFWETLDIQVQAFENNTLHDTVVLQVGAGQGTPVNRSVWFTPPWDGNWQLYARMYDQIGNPVESGEVLTLPTLTYNMEPVATGSLSSNESLTYLNIQFNGAGYDIWGLSTDNQTYSHNNSPVGYLWDFGDGGQSWLRTPSRAYTQVGIYNSTLRVTDVGGKLSQPQTWPMNITDDVPPVIRISVDGEEKFGSITLLTSERVRFSAHLSYDNVPDQYLDFSWDFGDGSPTEGGIGYIEADHEWSNGSANGTAYPLVLTVSDGTHIVNQTLMVYILNRIPRQIFDLPMEVDTLTPLPMPTTFVDDDGTIANWQWIFSEPVNLDGGELSLADAFDQTTSALENPTPAWRTPGLKNVTIIATDNDGNFSSAIIQVTVNNQRPVALFARPDDGDTTTVYNLLSQSFDPDGNSGNMTTIWTLSDLNQSIVNQTAIVHTFTTPGTHYIELVVIDELGVASLPKAYLIEIENPLPIPAMTIYEARDANTGAAIDAPSDDESLFTWRHTFTDEGDVFVAPNAWLRFNSSGSRDGDIQFAGMDVPLDQNDPNWNGIVEYSWDFGDGSPLVNSPNAWHAYTTPGIYVITLSLRDGFGTGDVNQSTRTVYVAQSPEIVTSDPFSDVVYAEGEHLLGGDAIDYDGAGGMQVWWDDDVTFDNDGDGIKDNDLDSVDSVVGPDALTYRWDIDDRVDADDDGDPRNDWQTQAPGADIVVNWSEPGEVNIILDVCSGVDVCTQKAYQVRVRDPDDKDDSLADFSIDSLLPKVEDTGMMLGVLLLMVMLLGWLVMRQPTEVEVDAQDAAATYDVSQVVTEGGVLGMDHHVPPSKPKHLTKDDRRSKESGYVRPVTSRRRR